jgi:hypothetical protein
MFSVSTYNKILEFEEIALRMLDIFNGIRDVWPAIKYEIQQEETHYQSFLGTLYCDEIVSFTYEDACKHIYIHARNNRSLGIILAINSDGTYEWEEKLSETCRDNILMHLESIIEKYRGRPTNESKYCEKVNAVVSGTYKPSEVPVKEAILKVVTVADKMVVDSGYTFIIDSNKSVYDISRRLFNTIKCGETYTFEMTEDGCVIEKIHEGKA